MKSKFLTLLEDIKSRYTQGGFTTGDVIKLSKNYKTTDSYKKLTSSVKQIVDDMVESGLVLRVSAVKRGEGQTPEQVSLDITREIAPGRYLDFATIPGDIVEFIGSYNDQPEVPDSLKYDPQITKEPQEVELDKKTDTFQKTRTATAGDSYQETDSNLPADNTTIPASPHKDASSPSVDSYTYMYMPPRRG